MLKRSMFLNPNVDLEGQERSQRRKRRRCPTGLCRVLQRPAKMRCFLCGGCRHNLLCLSQIAGTISACSARGADRAHVLDAG